MINWNALAQLMQQGGKPGSPPNVFGGMPDYISQTNKPQGGGGAPVDPNGMFAQQGGGGPKDLRRQSAPQPIEPEKVPWMQQKALGGFERGDLLLAGMGMLSGKNFKEGLGNASGVAFDAFGRQREEGEKKKQSEALVKAMVAKGVPVEEATAMAEFGPQVAFNDMYNTQAKDWREERTAIEDDRYEAQWLQELQRYETEQERLARLEAYGISRDEITDDQWQSEFGLRQTEAESNGGAGSYGLTGVWGWDEANNRPVYMQPSKSGGLRAAETPDGVTLLDPYNTSYDRKLGTLAADAEGDKNPALLGVEAAEADMARLSEQIDLAITQTNDNNTGFWGQANITATDLNATLKTIRASGAFTSLVNLKKQGGTLGALSDTELQLLESMIANVERSQSQEQLDRNLLELKNALQGSATRIRAAYEKEYAAGRYGTGRRGDGGAGRVTQGFSGPLSGGKVGPSGEPVPEGFE